MLKTHALEPTPVTSIPLTLAEGFVIQATEKNPIDLSLIKFCTKIPDGHNCHFIPPIIL